MLYIDGLEKRYTGTRREKAGVLAVNGIDLEVEEGDLFTLLGPSGCGKSTTLRCIAGLEQPDAGMIKVGSRKLFDSANHVNVSPSRRGLGMVFQSYAIWPHLSVFKNVAFPLSVLPRRKRPSRSEIATKVDHALGVIQLQHLRDRQATDLSGGQQQRLALARALVMEPPLLLLDEPLSNLDAKLREDMRFELKRLQRQLGLTAVYVTHDQTEALAMSRKIAVMNEGNIEQIGRPRDVYDRPQSQFVANFVGTSNILDGKVTGRESEGSYVVTTASGVLRVDSSTSVSVGDRVMVLLRPEHVEIREAQQDEESKPGLWRGTVLGRAFLGDAVEHRISIRGLDIRVRSSPSMSVREEVDVMIQIKDGWCTLIPNFDV